MLEKMIVELISDATQMGINHKELLALFKTKVATDDNNQASSVVSQGAEV